METKTRKELLEEILQRFCRVKTLNYEVIDDLLLQLKRITKTKGDEESSLLFIVRLARKELRKVRKSRSDADRSTILRNVLSAVTNDLTNHLRIYFQSPINSDQIISVER
jgi:hypothetical protein